MDHSRNSLILSGPLCLGSNGKAVQALQTQLNSAIPGQKLVIDGRFGKRTHAALLAFQHQKGLTADGVVGPVTAKALGWGYSGANARPYLVGHGAPPLSPLTPPMQVIFDVIRKGSDQFKRKLHRELQSSPEEHDKIVIAGRKLNRDYDAFIRDLNKDFSKTSIFSAKFSVESIKFSFLIFRMALLSGAPSVLGKYYARCKRLDEMPIVQAIGKLLRGEQDAAQTATQLQHIFATINRN